MSAAAFTRPMATRHGFGPGPSVMDCSDWGLLAGEGRTETDTDCRSLSECSIRMVVHGILQPRSELGDRALESRGWR